MKTLKLAAFATATLFAGTAFAQNELSVEDLAEQSGLAAREVAMVLGPSVSYSNYRTSYRRAKAQLVRTLGSEERFQQVAAAYREQQQKLASNDAS
jgi:hypothetical protein